MQILNVRLGPRSYDIAIGGGIHDAFVAFVRDRLPHATRALVIADTHTRPLAERFRGALGTGSIAVVPAGESSKSLATAGELYSQLAALEADRQTPVVGGGRGAGGGLAG